MAPSAERIEKMIGRELVPGDVLVQTPIYNMLRLDEVVENNIEDGEGSKKAEIEELSIRTRELFHTGPGNNTSIVPKDFDMWMDVIKIEDRKDHVSNTEEPLEKPTEPKKKIPFLKKIKSIINIK